MTSTASAPSSQGTGGNTAARQANASSAAGREAQSQKTATDLFSSLLGLASATGDEALLLDDVDGLDPSGLRGKAGKGSRHAQELDEDPNNLASANPLADLIGWRPAPLTKELATEPASGDDLAAQLALDPSDGLAPSTDGDTGIELKGMTMLAKSEAADPKLLAQLAQKANATTTPEVVADAAPGETLAPATKAAGGHSGALSNINTAQWRSTATLGAGRSTATAQTGKSSETAALQNAQSTILARGREAELGAFAQRSTLTLDQRFNSAATEGSTTSPLGLVSPTGASAQGHGGSASGGQQDGLAFGALTAADRTELDAPSEAFSLEGDLNAEEELDPNNFLSPDQLQEANLRVGGGTDEAIDIRLALAGDEVNVSFLSNNAEMRAGLQQHAGGTLADLMQRSGLQLSDVSVGAQSQAADNGQGGQSGNPSGQSQGRGEAGRSNASAANETHASPRPAPSARRADGGPALDVFA